VRLLPGGVRAHRSRGAPGVGGCGALEHGHVGDLPLLRPCRRASNAVANMVPFSRTADAILPSSVIGGVSHGKVAVAAESPLGVPLRRAVSSRLSERRASTVEPCARCARRVPRQRVLQRISARNRAPLGRNHNPRGRHHFLSDRTRASQRLLCNVECVVFLLCIVECDVSSLSERCFLNPRSGYTDREPSKGPNRRTTVNCLLAVRERTEGGGTRSVGAP